LQSTLDFIQRSMKLDAKLGAADIYVPTLSGR
jgi:hypothetical protein